MKIYQIIIGKVTCLLFSLLLLSNAAKSQQMISSSGERATECDPPDYNWNITQGSDAQGCYFDIKFNLIWSVGNMQMCTPMPFPHGLCVEVTGATITSTLGPVSSWFSGVPDHSNSYSRYWVKQPLGTCSPLINEIPSNTPQSVRIYVTGSTVGIPVTVTAVILNGNAWTSPTWWVPPVIPSNLTTAPFNSYWKCGAVQTFDYTHDWYTIGADRTVCQGDNLVLTISGSGPPILPASVTWYSAPCIPDPSNIHPPASPWTVAQNGGLTFNTNAINNCTYYYAVINNGCNTFYSNPLRVTVCPGKPIATGSITTSTGFILNPQNHACINWQGTFTVAVSPSPCKPSITWWRRVNGGGWTLITTPPNVTTTPAQTLLLSGSDCSTKHEIQARLVNACGTTYVDFTIYIDKPANGGTITTLTNMLWDIGSGTTLAPIICYNTGTRLLHTTPCGKIKYWEYRDEIAPVCSGNFPSTWTLVPGSIGTSVWWTNKLLITRQYRAFVENGACTGTNGAFSPPITVFVKPEFTVQISSAPNLLLCPTSLLTATTSYGLPCTYTGVSYQWYLNGVAIPNAIASTYTASEAGNYNVVVSDGKCGKATAIQPIKLCKPTIEIAGPCCICDKREPPDVNSVCAIVTGNCGVPLTGWQWYRDGVPITSGGNAQCLSVQSSGTYKVTVNCGPCVLTQSTTITPCKNW